MVSEDNYHWIEVTKNLTCHHTAISIFHRRFTPTGASTGIKKPKHLYRSSY